MMELASHYRNIQHIDENQPEMNPRGSNAQLLDLAHMDTSTMDVLGCAVLEA